MAETKRILIIGAGMSGLTAAITIRRQLPGFENFVIYEEVDDIGGTWKWNTYPGAASDVGTHWYCLSTDLNPAWTVSHVGQPELFAYWKALVKKYQLQSHIFCNTRVVSARWNEEHQGYDIQLQDVLTKEVKTEFANVLISANGLLSVPHYPSQFKNIDKFKGDHFHSARWNHRVDLKNKNVAVIGNGCSAAQILPSITKDSSVKITNFCRSPNWFAPDPRTSYSPLVRWIFSYVPLALRLYRDRLYINHDLSYLRTAASHKNPVYEKVLRNEATELIKLKAPKKYHDILIPDYSVGCRRMIFGTQYLEALHRPNVEVNYDDIVGVVDNGLTTKKGDILPFDVIIFATGFVVDCFPIELRGRTGLSVQEFYDQNGGPYAYKGTALPGFPNLYLLTGPNTGHGSALFTAEVQSNWIMQLIKPILRNEVSSFEPTEDATKSYNEMLRPKLENSIWSGNCSSWYRTGHSGKVSINFPGTQTEYWWIMRHPVWTDFKAVNDDKWLSSRRTKKATKRIVCLVLVLLGLRLNDGYLKTIVGSTWKYVLDRIQQSSGLI
ncbi:hypothetical protein C8Q75DRAFT_806348 [Abortiporus biennis]|nr:hypothetical protein C8Q75DRAFT_806348 [Abortiporus biennis]